MADYLPLIASHNSMEIVYLPFVLLGLAFLTCWKSREKGVWAGFAFLSVVSAYFLGNVTLLGVLILSGWALLWAIYSRLVSSRWQKLVFAILIVLSYGFKFHLFSGFQPLAITPRFLLGMESPWIGLFSLALFVPLALTGKEWREALTKGLWLTVAGIAAMILLAAASRTVAFEVHLPTFALIRYLHNLVLVSISEEAFYRGFVQEQLSTWLPNTRWGKGCALVSASLLFMLAHSYWSPNPMILAYTFLAGLLYGGVYMLSGRIESAILCHFLLNAIHMTFFSYHAM